MNLRKLSHHSGEIYLMATDDDLDRLGVPEDVIPNTGVCFELDSAAFGFPVRAMIEIWENHYPGEVRDG
jgi:hypothetical protein